MRGEIENKFVESLQSKRVPWADNFDILENILYEQNHNNPRKEISEEHLETVKRNVTEIQQFLYEAYTNTNDYDITNIINQISITLTMFFASLDEENKISCILGELHGYVKFMHKIAKNQISPLKQTSEDSERNSEYWYMLQKVLYNNENEYPRKEITEEYLVKINECVQFIQQDLLRTFLSNKPKDLENQFLLGSKIFDNFTSAIEPKQKVYFKIGELLGCNNLMRYIQLNKHNRAYAFNLFDEAKKSSEHVEKIIKHIGYNSVSVENLFNSINIDKNNLIDALDCLQSYNLIHCHKLSDSGLSDFDSYFLSDNGRIIFNHFNNLEKDRP